MIFGCSTMTTLLLSRVVDFLDTDSDAVRVDIELRLSGARFDELPALPLPGAQRPLPRPHHGSQQNQRGRCVRHICVENRK